jgi:plastocyanin
MTMTRRLAATIAAVFAVALAATAVPALAATKTVAVKNFAFSPSSLSVKAGTTVTWKVGGDRAAHNVTVVSGPTKFHSKTAMTFSYSKKLTKKGTYRLVCTIHAGMKQTIKVT